MYENSQFLSCRFTHDILNYLAAKPRDIQIPQVSDIPISPPFFSRVTEGVTDSEYPSIDLSTTCPLFSETGECRYGTRSHIPISGIEYRLPAFRYGFKCRFLGGHIRKDEHGALTLIDDEEKKAHAALTALEVNFVGSDTQKLLRSKKVKYLVYKSF
jgi:tRNA-dihydrouridine synthase 3